MPDYTITVLDISQHGLTELPDDIDKFTNLKTLNCGYNQITSLDNLPPNLKELYCYNNQITSLDNLPPTLKIINCSHNKITSLDNVLPILEILNCNNNKLSSLDNLPSTFKVLYCNNNEITSLDNLANGQLAGNEDKPLSLPPTLKLYCNGNPLKYDFEPTLENIRNYIASRMLST